MSFFSQYMHEKRMIDDINLILESDKIEKFNNHILSDFSYFMSNERTLSEINNYISEQGKKHRISINFDWLLENNIIHNV